MKPRYAILAASEQDVRDVLASLAPESLECLRGFELDSTQWPAIVETMRLESDCAYSVHLAGRAVCIFGAIAAGKDLVEAWLFYRPELKQCFGVTDSIRAVSDAEYARLARERPSLVARALSCLTFPESSIWMEMLGFTPTHRRTVLPTGRVAFIFERQTVMAKESAA